MPMCETTPYGAVAWLGKSDMNFVLLKNKMRDVVGIEIQS